MVNFAVPISRPDHGTPRAPLTWAQRHPRAVVAMGITLIIMFGVTGLLASLGGAL